MLEAQYSVLMSVYRKENPEFLEKSMNSIFNQTYPTNDFVLICDGPLTEELDIVIEKMQKKFGNILNVIRLKENKGLGNALNFGIKECKNEIIARMDSDDISVPKRCEEQIKFMMANQEYGIVGSVIAEFSEDENIINSYRIVPENSEEIVKFCKFRNPFNHPSIMFKKSLVLKSGNYKDVRYMQDYFLWIDMISNQIKGYNIQKPLVLMRANENLFKRRSGKQYLKIQKDLLSYMKNKKLINIFEYIFFLCLRTCSALAPNFMRKSIFKKILRKRNLKNEF